MKPTNRHNQPTEISEATSTRTWLALVVLLGLALLVRIPLLVFPGHEYDLSFFAAWTEAVHEKGVVGALESDPPVDYPAVPVLLWPIAEAYGPFMDDPARDDDILLRLVKLPGVAGDLLVTLALFAMTRGLAGQRCYPGHSACPRSGLPVLRRLSYRSEVPVADVAALTAAAIWAFNPAVIFGSAYWGQIDSWITLAMLGAIAASVGGWPALSGMALAAGFALKPQAALVAPAIVLAIYTTSGPRGVWWWLAGTASGLALTLGYFALSGGLPEIVETYERISDYRYRVSYNAWNIWWPAEISAGATPGDSPFTFAGQGISYQSLGTVVLAAAFPVILLRQRCGQNSVPGIFLTASFSIFLVFMVATAVHERYIVYIFGVLAPLAAFDRRWLAVYGALSFSALLNMSAALPPADEWGKLANGEVLSLAITSLNLALLGVFAMLMFSEVPRSRWQAPQEPGAASLPVMSMQ
jgi:hypothetical protein